MNAYTQYMHIPKPSSLNIAYLFLSHTYNTNLFKELSKEEGSWLYN